MNKFLSIVIACMPISISLHAQDQNIAFADSKVKEICVANWDSNGDGELSTTEAAAVTDFGKLFQSNTEITAFDELQYFTGLTSIKDYAFIDCANLSAITIPNSVTSLGVASFRGCWKLQSLTIPNSVTTLYDKIFYDCGIKSIMIPKSVTSIGISLFKNCPDLTAITVEDGNPIYDSRNNCNAIIETSSNTLIASCKNTKIPQTVTTIGESAFCYCSGLTSITVPSNVSVIQSEAFRDCFDLISITLPNTITNIETRTFWGCHVLESFVIPKSVTSIGNQAFGRCLELTSITIPNSVTSISNNAFTMNSNIASVIVGSNEPISISNFYNRANAILYVPVGSKAAYEAASVWNEFKEIVEIENIAFADSKVKEICVANWDSNGDGELSYAEAAAVPALNEAFKLNTDITSFDELKYFTGLTSIGAFEFFCCSNLTSIEIPKNVSDFGYAAFEKCSSLTKLAVNSENKSFDSRNNCNAIIETANNLLIVGCNTTIIPNNITGISGYSFYNCSGLSSIEIPSSVTRIDDYAFFGCTGLTSIEIPYSVTSIGEGAFDRCSNLTVIAVGNNAPIEITSNVFSNRANATLYIPGGSKAAYEAANVWNEFKEMIENENIAFADSKVKEICIANWDTDKDGELSYVEATAIESLGEAFKDNTEIKYFNELQYFTGINVINAFAFYGCTNLECVILPRSAESIKSHAFENCELLSALHIPANVSSIGDAAIRAANGLVRLTVDENNPVFDSRNNCNAVIKTATNTLVVGCNTSKTPNGVTAIGTKAFRKMTKIPSIIIPNSVTVIGDFAFDSCDRLTSVTVNSDTPFAISDNVFSNRANANLFVPAGSKAAYSAADIWKEFNRIIEMDNISFADSKVKETLLNADFGNVGLGSWNTGVTYDNMSVTVGDYVLASDDFTNDNKWAHTNGNWTITDGTLQQSALEESCISVFNLPARNTYSYKVRARKDSGNEGFLIIFNRIDGSNYAWWNIGGWDNKAHGIEVITNGSNEIVTYQEGSVETGRWYDIEIRLTYDYIICLLDNVVIHKISRKSLHSAIDANGDNEIAKEEAAAITNIGTIFKDNREITSFDEFQHFTGIKNLMYAFYDCRNLRSVVIPANIDSLKAHSFENCNALNSLEIPANVKYVNDAAIRGANGLTKLTVDENNSIYDSRDNCNAVIETSTSTLVVGCNTSVIPDDVKAIGLKAFRNMTRLTTINIPNSITSIGEKAFCGCTNLATITIPNSVTNIESNIFESCTSLYSIIVEEGNQNYDSRNNCNAIIETATNKLISGCKNSIVPNGISAIGDYAFYRCKDLTSITIPSSVTSIGAEAFNGCYSLDTVIVGNSTPIDLADGSVFRYRTNATLYVPAGSKAAYEAANVWNEFKEIKSQATVTVGKYGISTFSSPYALDFTNVSGMKAYAGVGFNKSTGSVLMVAVKTTNAGEGLLVKGEPGEYVVPEIEYSDEFYNNLLVGTPVETVVSKTSTEGGIEYTSYKFAKKSGEEHPKFYVVPEAGAKSSAGTAYLRLRSSWVNTASEAKTVNIVFDDEDVTGIEEFVSDNPTTEKAIYDMQGRRVLNPAKGLYIVNGKKIVIK